MKLAVKINFILLPVMIFVFSIAGIFSYYSQKAQLLSSLSKEVRYDLLHISTTLKESVHEIDFLSRMFLGGEKVENFLHKVNSGEDQHYIEKELIQYIQQLDLRNGLIKSFALLDFKKNAILFYDFSDPFSTLTFSDVLNNHLSYVEKSIKNKGISYIQPISYQYNQTASGEDEMVLIRTFSPEQSISSLSFSRGLAIYTAIITVRLSYRKDYFDLFENALDKGFQVTISSQGYAHDLNNKNEITVLPESASSYGFQLVNELWNISIFIPNTYLTTLYLPYKFLFIIIVFVVTLITFVIIKVLITKQIISPVIKLTKQIQKADFRDNLNIERLQANDEISLLTNKYHDLIMELDDSAKRDNLTGLPNRNQFNINIKRIVENSLRYKEKCAVIYFDLDNFKSVNDKYGHYIGDQLLIEFSRRLVESYVDLEWDSIEVAEFEFARISGDEFAIIMSGIKNLDVINIFVQKIMSLFDGGFNFDHKHFDLGVSIGISVCPDDATNVYDIVKNADTAMYSAKKEGKNSYKFYSHDLECAIKRHEIILASLKQALQQQEFYLVYMPVFDCQDGSIKGAEALLRATSTDLLSYGPEEFIPIAETSGMIKDIDYWVIESALKHLAQWIEQFAFDGILAINFSSWQLQNPEFVGKVAYLIKKYNVPPQCIELEITETCFVAGENRNIEMLTALHNLGVKLSLDDFGTGFTAFSQLIDYPVDTLKVDRMFINAINPDNTNDRLLVDIIVEIASLYNLNIIAEGVETELQLKRICELGFHQVQGFLLSKPLIEDAFINLWKSESNILFRK